VSRNFKDNEIKLTPDRRVECPKMRQRSGLFHVLDFKNVRAAGNVAASVNVDHEKVGRRITR
jgi:hypothetical protein